MGSDFRRFVGRDVVVQLDDMAIQGTLVRDGRDFIELENAGSLSADGDRRPIDGTVLIPVMRIDWIQVP